ncbi:SdrD B-like domain-containing protein [Cellulomonas algicola]|uniref:SdrD B-like domain-containing protein n=1 Tax=Cellulomonas algicola TaxID=2071633 RepID=UPI000F58BD54|nr:SdrD B-like domain-containing protein [Cellulomonas algicola]
MTTDSRPEPPAGAPRTAPVPVVPSPRVPSPAVSSPAVSSPAHLRASLASVVLGTVGALAAVGLGLSLLAPDPAPAPDERAVLLDDHAVPPPTFALVTSAWGDDDADGLRGAAERPLGGVFVHLETADARPAHHPDGSVVAAATTGADGTAVFDDLAGGVYRVRWELPAGYALTTAVAAPGRALVDSDAEPVAGDMTRGRSGPVALTEQAGLDLPAAADDVTADRVARGVDVGATPVAQVLDVAQG